MSGYPGIQSFLSEHTTSPSVSQAVTDWKNGPSLVVYADAGPPRASRFAIRNGSEKAYGNLTDVTAPECGACDADGNVYFTKDLSNYTGVVKYGTDLVELFSYGTPGPTLDDNIALPAQMAVVSIGAASWLVTVGLTHGTDFGPQFGALLLGDTITNTNWTFDTSPGESGTIIAGPTTTTTAVAYVMLEPYFTDPNQALAFYTITITLTDATDPTTATFASVLTGSIQASAMDDSWVDIKNNGFLFDTTDSMVVINTTPATTDGGVIAKIDPSDCSIVWKVPIRDPSGDNDQFSLGRITKGFLSYFSQPGIGDEPQVITIDTKTGIYSVTSTGLEGVTASAQCCDDKTPCIIAYGSYARAPTGSPIPLHDTPDTFTGWYALFIQQIGAITYTFVRILNGAPA